MTQRTCTIEGCSLPHHAKGLCDIHYGKRRATGDPLHDPHRLDTAKLIAWLESHKDDAEGECLLWPFRRDMYGYGVVGKRLAHRMMCGLVHGPAKPGNVAAHWCGNGHLGCVHPKHLRWATQAENMADMVRHGRSHYVGPKLDEAAVRRIRLDRRPHAVVAKEHAVSARAIRAVRSGKSWANVQ